MEEDTTTNYEYKVVEASIDMHGRHRRGAVENTLNEETEGDWEFMETLSGSAQGLLIFRRPA